MTGFTGFGGFGTTSGFGAGTGTTTGFGAGTGTTTGFGAPTGATGTSTGFGGFGTTGFGGAATGQTGFGGGLFAGIVSVFGCDLSDYFISLSTWLICYLEIGRSFYVSVFDDLSEIWF